jgi:hypothetical protein
MEEQEPDCEVCGFEAESKTKKEGQTELKPMNKPTEVWKGLVSNLG